MPPEDTLQIDIHGIGAHGEGVGQHEGYTIFVDGALPKERVDVRLEHRAKRYGRAQLLRILEPSPDRIAPPCKLFGTCGGCQLMHLSYPKQLEIKRQKIVDALQRIGKIEHAPVEACIPSPKTVGYRNKIQLPVEKRSEGISIGLFERSSHRLVEVEECPIHCDLGERAYRAIRSILKQAGQDLPLRHILIKSAVYSQEILVVLVTKVPPTELLFDIAKQIIAACPLVKGVVHNRHDGPDNVILGSVYQTLEGSPLITETLCGLKFSISPASFFQVNPLQAEQLYLKALALAELTGEETVLDAYCGVGTLSLIFAKKAKRVIGVEVVKEAIRDAKNNALQNQIENVRFVLAQAEQCMASIPPIDIALLNPPRKGCDGAFLQALGRLSPQKLIYISCDPATLARDLAYLTTFGYNIEQLQPFDMFPQTAHVECVTLLKKRKL